jgi:glycosyltransferase involved in cell wall biosynthesis
METLAEAANVRTLLIEELGPRVQVAADLRALVRLLRITFEQAPDVIHTHTAKAGTLGRLAAAIYNATRCRPRRALVVHTFHGHVLVGYFGRLGTAAVRLVERALALLTDCIITISPSQSSDIVTRFKVAPAGRVAVVPLGLDLQTLAAVGGSASRLRDRLNLPAAAVVFGYLGRFVPIKDLDTLLAAFELVARQMPEAWLLLAGDGSERKHLEESVASSSSRDRVRFVGWTNDLTDWYAAIDVSVLSSLNEGTPVALIEAMAAARPVVATAVGGVPDVVEHGMTGLTVPSRDPGAFAAAMSVLGRDDALRRRMGHAGRDDVVRRFSEARLVADIEQLYRERLACKRGTV